MAKHKDAKDVWEALRVQYLGSKRVQKSRLQTIDDFSDKLSGIATKFKCLRSILEDEIILIRKMLNSVSKTFLQIVASIEQYSEIENMSLE